MAIWVIINVEVWDFNAPMARSIIPYPQGKVVIPDVANYSWYDYGTRVGFWRLDDQPYEGVLFLTGSQIVDRYKSTQN